MVSKELSETAVEINEILKNISPEMLNKIPKKFINFMQQIASDTYKFEYDKTKTLENQNIKPKTKGLIALIYKDFLCNKQEKQEYMKYISKVSNDMEKEKREIYNTDNIFKTHKKDEIIQEKTLKNTTAMVEYKEPILKKLINKIKNIFNIN